MTHLPACCCNDRDAQQVAAMVARGVDQIEASHLVYGTGPVLGSSTEFVKAWTTKVVGDLFAPLRKRWGL